MDQFVRYAMGWPGVILFLAVAFLAIWRKDSRIMLASLALALPSAYYLASGSGWIFWAGLYLIASLAAAAYLLYIRQVDIAKLLLLPIVVLYAWLRYNSLMAL